MRFSDTIKVMFISLALAMVIGCNEEAKKAPQQDFSRGSLLGMRIADNLNVRMELIRLAKIKLGDSKKTSVGADAGTEGFVLTVVGAESKEMQNRITNSIVLEQKRNGWNTIHIIYYKTEALIDNEEGSGYLDDRKANILAIKTLESTGTAHDKTTR